MSIQEEDSVPQEDDFITVAGAAELAGRLRGRAVSQITIRRWLDDPDIKVTKYVEGSGRVWIDRKEIIAYTTPRPVGEAALRSANR